MYEFIQILNNSKVLWGVTMLMLNFGSRFVVADLGKFHESILATEFVKKVIVFSMFFVATRDVLTAFILTIMYVFLIDGIFHEKRKYCIVPNKYKEQKIKDDINETQYLQAKQPVIQYEMQNKKEYFENNNTSYNNYANNIKMLNSKSI